MLKLIQKIGKERIYWDGFSKETALGAYCVNPYVNGESAEFCVSFSFLNKGLDYKTYEKYEKTVVSAFEQLFSKYKVIGFKYEVGKHFFIEYTSGFLSFREDFVKALREDTSYKFILVEQDIVIDCNFDLNVVLFNYNEDKDVIKSLLAELESAGLGFREILD